MRRYANREPPGYRDSRAATRPASTYPTVPSSVPETSKWLGAEPTSRSRRPSGSTGTTRPTSGPRPASRRSRGDRDAAALGAPSGLALLHALRARPKVVQHLEVPEVVGVVGPGDDDHTGAARR